MWFIVINNQQHNNSNAHGDDILGYLQAQFPGGTVYRHTTVADHTTTEQHLSATHEVGDPAVVELLGNIAFVDEGTIPPVLLLKDKANVTIATQALVLVV